MASSTRKARAMVSGNAGVYFSKEKSFLTNQSFLLATCSELQLIEQEWPEIVTIGHYAGSR